MPSLKVALQLGSLGLPLMKSLLAARQMGVSAVELDAREIKPKELSSTGLRQLKKMLSDVELRVAAVSFRTRRGYDVADDLDRRVDATRDALQFAHALGAPVLVNQVGRVPANADEPGWTLLVQALTDLGAHGQRVGAILSAETGTESGADLARLLAALPDGSMGVTLNPGKLIVNNFSTLEAVEHLGAYIDYVHATDGVRDRAQGRGMAVSLGRGAADYPALLGAMEERGYRGYWTVERINAGDSLEEVSQAVQYLKSL